MNIKPPNKSDETHRKYKYLIWRDDVGFMHLESFTLEELKSFSQSLEKEMTKFLSEGSDKSLTNNNK
tara:strand:- start:154 stop:354 length:201 start_codon:yes stop_codon:yes gene_type:complete